MPEPSFTTQPEWFLLGQGKYVGTTVVTPTSTRRNRVQVVLATLGWYLNTQPVPRALSNTLNELKVLQHIEDDPDDEYTFRPSPHASARTLSYIQAIYEAKLKAQVNTFPKPHLELDGEGGLVLDWRDKGNGKIIRLACRANQHQRDYLYYQSRTEHRAIEASPTALLDRLEWINNAE